MPPPHPPEFRRRAVELARERAKPIAQVLLGALARVGREVDRPQLADPLAEHGAPAGPADALGDHRRRHTGELGQDRRIAGS